MSNMKDQIRIVKEDRKQRALHSQVLDIDHGLPKMKSLSREAASINLHLLLKCLFTVIFPPDRQWSSLHCQTFPYMPIQT